MLPTIQWALGTPFSDGRDVQDLTCVAWRTGRSPSSLGNMAAWLWDGPLTSSSTGRFEGHVEWFNLGEWLIGERGEKRQKG